MAGRAQTEAQATTRRMKMFLESIAMFLLKGEVKGCCWDFSQEQSSLVLIFCFA